MNKYISQHAFERGKERYNFEFDNSFIDYALKNGIKQEAINRKGHIVKNENRGIYRCVYKDMIVEYVLSFHNNGDICICTFNKPPKNMDDICYSYARG